MNKNVLREAYKMNDGVTSVKICRWFYKTKLMVKVERFQL